MYVSICTMRQKILCFKEKKYYYVLYIFDGDYYYYYFFPPPTMYYYFSILSITFFSLPDQISKTRLSNKYILQNSKMKYLDQLTRRHLVSYKNLKKTSHHKIINF